MILYGFKTCQSNWQGNWDFSQKVFMEGVDKLNDIYKVTRGQIEHVNNNLSQRVIWLVIAQSFFFGAFVNLVCGVPQEPAMKNMQQMLLMLFPIASIATVVFSYVDIIISIRKLLKLKKHFLRQQAKEPIDNGYPAIDGEGRFSFMENAVPVMVPLVFVVAWTIILLIC
jgi:hypothetical protein